MQNIYLCHRHRAYVRGAQYVLIAPSASYRTRYLTRDVYLLSRISTRIFSREEHGRAPHSRTKDNRRMSCNVRNRVAQRPRHFFHANLKRVVQVHGRLCKKKKRCGRLLRIPLPPPPPRQIWNRTIAVVYRNAKPEREKERSLLFKRIRNTSARFSLAAKKELCPPLASDESPIYTNLQKTYFTVKWCSSARAICLAVPFTCGVHVVQANVFVARNSYEFGATGRL